MKILILFFFSILCTNAMAAFHGDVEAGVSSFNNPLYLDDPDTSSTAYQINPRLKYDLSSDIVYADIELDAEYTNFSGVTGGDILNSDLQLETGLGNGQTKYLGLFAKTSREKNLIDNELGVAPPVFNDTSTGIVSDFSISKKSSIYLHYEQSTTDVDLDDFAYLNSKKSLAYLGYRFRFLPETFFFLQAESFDGKFKDGLINENSSDDNVARRLKYDYTGTGIIAGVKGKLTKYTSIDASFGLKQIDYDDDNQFSEPVFSFVFTDQITPKDSLIAGYIYSVEDSSFTNWVLKQDMNIGYAKIINDTFLFLLKMSYIYYSYSEPQRREDQRLLAKMQFDYVFSPGFAVVTKLNMDILVSDAYDLDSSADDKPASYQAGDFGIYLKSSF
ncbi:MAG: hypothetical protein VX583_13080 [Bdellovibrionota bacterium]|nr:hypothetical protein [Pseudobdellovibrionaceae bacterium]|tara:strand:+ start:71704 stop:72867 length:1164 start_codon:yes stop_codon:yes gene_type:complete